MNIGITGAAGVIGTHLREHLSRYPNINFRSSMRHRHDNIDLHANESLYIGDFANIKYCENFLEDLDVVIHLAHSSIPLKETISLNQEVVDNLTPSLNLIESAQKKDRKIHIVYLSSGGTIYGDSKHKVPFTESSPIEPANLYGLQKSMIEHLLRIYSNNGSISSTVLRVASAYSHINHSSGKQGFLGLAVKSAVNNLPIRVIGDLDNTRDFIHVDDVCNAITLSLGNKSNFEVYNIGTGFGTSVQEALSIIEEVIQKPLEVIFENYATASNLVSWNVLEASKAREKLGWSPKIDLHTGIQKLIEAQSKNL